MLSSDLYLGIQSSEGKREKWGKKSESTIWCIWRSLGIWNPICGTFPAINLWVIWRGSSLRRPFSGAEKVKAQEKTTLSQEDLHLQDSRLQFTCGLPISYSLIQLTTTPTTAAPTLKKKTRIQPRPSVFNGTRERRGEVENKASHS